MPGPGIPHISWGRFYDQEGGIHVAPAVEGYLMYGHYLSLKCACSPLLDEGVNGKGNAYRIVVHNVIN